MVNGRGRRRKTDATSDRRAVPERGARRVRLPWRCAERRAGCSVLDKRFESRTSSRRRRCRRNAGSFRALPQQLRSLRDHRARRRWIIGDGILAGLAKEFRGRGVARDCIDAAALFRRAGATDSLGGAAATNASQPEDTVADLRRRDSVRLTGAPSSCFFATLRRVRGATFRRFHHETVHSCCVAFCERFRFRRRARRILGPSEIGRASCRERV